MEALLALLGLHVLLTAGLAASGRRLGSRALLVAAAAPAVTGVWAASRAVAGLPATQAVEWVPALGLGVVLRADGFSVLLAGLIGLVGTIVLTWAWLTIADRDGGRLAALLTAFLGGMVGIVLADGLLTLFLFWEVTTVTSFLLIGFSPEQAEARRSARQALVVTGAGGLALLAGLVVLGQASGTTTVTALTAAPPTGTLAEVGLALVLLGAFTKSAQVPFHGWLAGAMVAPTPVSALLHSATMVKAGIVVIAQLAPAFAPVAWWRPTLVGVGVATFVWGGWRAWRSDDGKALLAGTTVAMLGLLTTVYGIGTPKAMLAGTALLVAHALYKAGLFLAVGTVEKLTGTRDLPRIPDLRGVARPMVVAVVVLGASMGGLPPLFAYAAKEAGFVAVTDAGTGVVWSLGLAVGTALSLAAAVRLVRAVITPAATDDSGARAALSHKASGLGGRRIGALGAGPVLLAGASVVLGVVAPLATALVAPAAESLAAGADAFSLTLWAGFNAALAVSVAGIVLGGLLAAFGTATRRLPTFGSWSRATEAVLDGLAWTATRTAEPVERQAAWTHVLPVATAAVALVGARLALTAPTLTGSSATVVEVLLVGAGVAAGVGVVLVRERIAAVLLIGMVGYLMAGIFLLRGAPDLALTQILVETVAVVAFVLVLRRLPRRGPAGARPWRRPARATVAVATGTVAGLALLAGLAVSGPRPVADAAVAEAVPEGGGANVVNVILTDFRALDTVGEVAVLATAAVGVLALVRARRTDDG